MALPSGLPGPGALCALFLPDCSKRPSFSPFSTASIRKLMSRAKVEIFNLSLFFLSSTLLRFSPLRLIK